MDPQMRGNLGEKHAAELAQFLFAHADDAGELAFAGRIIPRHLAQADIGENDVGRHAALVGELLAQLAQTVEQDLVAGDFAGAVDLGFAARSRAG